MKFHEPSELPTVRWVTYQRHMEAMQENVYLRREIAKLKGILSALKFESSRNQAPAKCQAVGEERRRLPRER